MEEGIAGVLAADASGSVIRTRSVVVAFEDLAGGFPDAGF